MAPIQGSSSLEKQKNSKEIQSSAQMLMARNIARLMSKDAQKWQAHLLCQSLKKSILEAK